MTTHPIAAFANRRSMGTRCPRRVGLWLVSALCLTLLALAVPARAMSVIAPSFEELVAESEYVVRGTVTDVHAEAFTTPTGTAIRTLVTLRVERALKGAPGESVTIYILGGKVGSRRIHIEGLPEFHVGDRQIVFYAHNGTTVCPLIAAGHGRYHVKHDEASGRDFVLRDNGAPLTSTAEVRQSLEAPVDPTRTATALGLGDFESRITAAAGAPAGSAR